MHTPSPRYSYFKCFAEDGKLLAAGTVYAIHDQVAKYFDENDLQKFSKLGFGNAVKRATEEGNTNKVPVNKTNGQGFATYLRFEKITHQEMQAIKDQENQIDFIAIPNP